MNLVAGIDEVGTESQVSEGWAYCVLERAGLAEVERAVAGRRIHHFHGKRFKIAQADDYRTLLTAVREQLEASEASRLLFTLNDLAWKAEFVPVMQRLVSQAMERAGIADPECEAIIRRLFPSLVTLQRLTRQLGAAGELEIEIDAESVTEPLNTLAITVQGREVHAARLLARAYNGYQKVMFPDSPVLALGGLRVVSDSRSLAVQIADVFGHFALCHVYKRLGCTNSRRAAKADLLEEVFGDALGHQDLTKMARIIGNNDIEILTPGALTLPIIPV